MEIENNNRLTQQQKLFFQRLSFYIDKPIYFYGSINRPDYIPGKSDIDIAIFTDNESSTIQLLCNFLDSKKKDFKKTVYKINSSMVYGYKSRFNDELNNIDVEIAIYDLKYKELVLRDQNCNIPFYITILLLIVKTLFYNLKIISKKLYKRIKRFLMNPNDELKFIEVDN